MKPDGTLLIEKGATKNNIAQHPPRLKRMKQLEPFGLTTQILLTLWLGFLFITEMPQSGSQTSRPSAPSGTDMRLPVFLPLYHSNV